MNQKGFILPTVIVMGAILTGITLTWSAHQFSSYNQTILAFHRIQALNAARSGLDVARYRLEIDDNRIDGPEDEWYQPASISIAGLNVSVRTEDELSKLNINSLVYPSGEVNTGISRIAQRLLTERNRTMVVRTLQNPANPYLAFFLSPGMLHRVPGTQWTDSQIQSVTVFGHGRININTATPDVLKTCLGNGSDTLCRRVIDQRQESAFSSVFDFRDRLGLSDVLFREVFPILTVNSSYFSIVSEVESGTVQASARIVVHRSAGTTRIIRYREWIS
jgi:type II secretory pathway component PulK